MTSRRELFKMLAGLPFLGALAGRAESAPHELTADGSGTVDWNSDTFINNSIGDADPGKLDSFARVEHVHHPPHGTIFYDKDSGGVYRWSASGNPPMLESVEDGEQKAAVQDYWTKKWAESEGH